MSLNPRQDMVRLASEWKFASQWRWATKATWWTWTYELNGKRHTIEWRGKKSEEKLPSGAKLISGPKKTPGYQN